MTLATKSKSRLAAEAVLLDDAIRSRQLVESTEGPRHQTPVRRSEECASISARGARLETLAQPGAAHGIPSATANRFQEMRKRLKKRFGDPQAVTTATATSPQNGAGSVAISQSPADVAGMRERLRTRFPRAGDGGRGLRK